MRISRKAADQMGLTPEARERERERRRADAEEEALEESRARAEREAARTAARRRRKDAERRALDSDASLREALDRLDAVTAAGRNAKQKREPFVRALAAAEAERSRLADALARATEAVGRARADLEAFDNWNVEGYDGSIERVREAWERHERAWSSPEISASMRKNSRDRSVRRRAKALGVNRQGK